MSLDITLTCKCCGTDVYESNITHNLNTMARKAYLYKYLWRSGENNIKIAKDLILPLEKGLALLKSNRKYFEKFNSDNGWGNYDNLLEFIEKLLVACKNFENAEVYSCR